MEGRAVLMMMRRRQWMASVNLPRDLVHFLTSNMTVTTSTKNVAASTIAWITYVPTLLYDTSNGFT